MILNYTNMQRSYLINKIAIIISGGLGDTITYLSRLPELCKKENVDNVDIFVAGGMQNSRNMIVDICELSDNVGNVFSNHNINSYYDNVLNWMPEKNPLEYNIQIPHIIHTTKENKEFAEEFLKDVINPVVVNPYTLSGNPDAISQKYMRSPNEDFWYTLLVELENNNFTPIIIGGKSDYIDWKFVNCLTYYGEFYEFLNSIALINSSLATIGTDSWPWEVSHYANKPTVSISLINTYWFDLHIGNNTDNLLIYREVPKTEDIISFLAKKLCEVLK